jgi:hypothetical protein
MEKKKKPDPIPEEFNSYEEAAEFWDSHDTTDYLEYLTPVEATTEFRGRFYDIEIEESVAVILREAAKRKGVTPSRLASDLLRQRLVTQS